MTENEMVGCHHRLNGRGFGWAQRVGDGQGGLVYVAFLPKCHRLCLPLELSTIYLLSVLTFFSHSDLFEEYRFT